MVTLNDANQIQMIFPTAIPRSVHVCTALTSRCFASQPVKWAVHPSAATRSYNTARQDNFRAAEVNTQATHTHAHTISYTLQCLVGCTARYIYAQLGTASHLLALSSSFFPLLSDSMFYTSSYFTFPPIFFSLAVLIFIFPVPVFPSKPSFVPSLLLIKGIPCDVSCMTYDIYPHNLSIWLWQKVGVPTSTIFHWSCQEILFYIN